MVQIIPYGLRQPNGGKCYPMYINIIAVAALLIKT